jgi:protein-L-isoaspartate(D-aspartate) O-methyltransferase
MTADYSRQRIKMVDGQLRTTDVTSAPILQAMLEVPRELFVPARRRELAYIDEDILLGGSPSADDARYLMKPSPFAKLLQLADIRPNDFVLDIGCATGYSAAVLSRLAGSVVALESDETFARLATETLDELGIGTVAVVQGPLEAGYPPEAPYDVIVLNGSVDRVPEAILRQLRDGGRLAAVQGAGHAGVARLYVREGGVVSSRRGFNAAVKPLPGFQKQPVFDF